MNYLGIFVLNAAALALYYQSAIRYNIYDKPNERSSHNYTAIRGAGVIFLITGLWWAFSNINFHLYFTIGLLLIGLVSLLDDIFTMSNILRFLVQVIAVILAMMNIDLSSSILLLMIILVLYVGWINAFNFMDGINGITSFYSLSILLPLLLVVNEYSIPFAQLICYMFISLIVFMFLNVRVKALAFCGDVGAVTLSYILAYLVLFAIVQTGKVEMILFGSVYGVDAIYTILRRLINGQNIFQSHRTHLYQLLSNELKWHYLTVSLIYSFAQLAISMLVIFFIQLMPQYSLYAAMLILLLFSIVYLYSRSIVVAKVQEGSQGGSD